MQLALTNSLSRNPLKGLIKKTIQLIPLKLCLNIQYLLLKRLETVIPQYIYLPFVNELYAASLRKNSQAIAQQYEDAQDLLVNLGRSEEHTSELQSRFCRLVCCAWS